MTPRAGSPATRGAFQSSRVLGAAIALALLAGPAPAQTEVAFGDGTDNSDQPVEVTADRLDVDRDAGTALFTGNVLVVQGGMRLLGDVVDVLYGPDPAGGNRIERVEATGNVVLVNGPDAAEGARAVYTVETGQVVMTGDVLLTQGENAITGEQLVVDVDTGIGEMTGRVRVLFLPEDDAGAGEPAE